MVLTTFQSQIQGLRPLDTTKKVEFEQGDLGEDQRYFVDKVHPAYESCKRDLKADVLGLRDDSGRTSGGDGKAMSADDDDGESRGERSVSVMEHPFRYIVCILMERSLTFHP